jgi:hypothetical protein
MSKQIIIVKPKSLSPKDKEKLTKAGHVVIEHEDSSQVVFKAIPEPLPYVFINCSSCGDRMYMTSERFETLKKNGLAFYCTHGHESRYAKKKEA